MRRGGSKAVSEEDSIADRYGVEAKRPSPSGEDVPVPEIGRRKILSALKGLPPARTPHFASDPPKCFLPDFASTDRVWGLSCQLYELRSERNWGMGDFADLRSVIGLAKAWGADFVGLNPLHAPFLAAPDRCSPYEPSNRGFLNPLYIAVDEVEGFTWSPEVQGEIEQLRLAPLVDYGRVARVKLDNLRRVWRSSKHLRRENSVADREFSTFRHDGGEALRLHALFEAISEAQVVSGGEAGWHRWPEPYRDPKSKPVSRFAEEHEDEVAFHMWLQWLAHRQLLEAADHAQKLGMRIGLYLDVAVGEALDGSGTWSNRGIYVQGASIGSPPDPMAASGQDWRLAAFHPSAIAEGEPSPFEKLMSAVMRYAGAVRIDHAAALRRLFLVPAENGPEQGAYVAYPQPSLIATLAALSERYRCVVIGEDLGNLPKGLQAELAAANILSYRIISYEQTRNGFRPAADYPSLALACVSTHDHQTFVGWWKAADVEMRISHGLVSGDAGRQQMKDRKRERRQVLRAFKAAGLPVAATGEATVRENDISALAVMAHRFIAKTPSLLVAVRLADVTDEKQPTNVPGTSDTYPNWKPKLSVTVEELADLAHTHPIIVAVGEERRSPRAVQSTQVEGRHHSNRN
ncbi:4-alpha-glucanotransferase (Amylomaltase) [Neorhizobium galegae bv. officinalis]|nr:4-alpha-glucanotransferase (Amylomaltase) [Neorhizobium galegae bv. officinalis]CDZ38396.1 4-alpha-glucanotransferase (Amylomaltase) [Neorhizobium galegae bv. officinalis]